MAGHQIAEGWERLTTQIASWFGANSAPASQPESAIREAVSSVETFIRESPTPYTPDTRHDRSDSSLHLSC